MTKKTQNIQPGVLQPTIRTEDCLGLVHPRGIMTLSCALGTSHQSETQRNGFESIL